MSGDATRDPTAHAPLLRAACAAYSRQDVDALLALVTDDVDWPDGSTRLHGRRAVRAYWLDRWTRTRTHDEPLSFTPLPGGRVGVRVDQVVRALDGSVLSRGRFTHVCRVEGSRSPGWTSRRGLPT